MSFDPSIMLATVAGAVVGLVGEWVGRFSTRTQEARLHQRARADWEHQQGYISAAREEEASRERGQAAAARIIGAFQQNPIGPLADQSSFEQEQLHSLLITLAYDRNFISDKKLRHRLAQASAILEVLGTDPPAGLTTPIVVWAVRRNVNTWLANLLRGEDLLEPTPTWASLCEELALHRVRLQKALERHGVPQKEFDHDRDFS